MGRRFDSQEPHVKVQDPDNISPGGTQLTGEIATALDVLGDGLIVLDHSRHVHEVNRPAAELLGLRAADLVGRMLWDVLPYAADVDAMFNTALAERRPIAIEHRLAKSGRHVEIRASAVDDDLVVLLRDVRGLPRDQQQQRHDEQRRVAIDAAQMGTWDYDVANDRIFWDQRTAELLNSTVKDEPVTLEQFVELIHDEDRERMKSLVKTSVTAQTEGFYDIEYRLKPGTGEQRWLRAAGQVFFDESKGRKRAVRIVGVVYDITLQKGAERAITQVSERERANAAHIKALMDAVPAIVLVAHDPECRQITGSRSAHDLLRLPHDANLSITADPPERPTHFRLFKDDVEVSPEQMPVQRAARGEETYGEEFELRFDDGTTAHLLGNAVPLREPDGRIRGSLAAFVDITQRKQAESALRRNEQRLRGIFNNAAVGIAQIHLEGKILDVNDTLCSMFGYTCEEMVGVFRVDDLTYGEDTAIVRAIRERIRRGEMDNIATELRFLRKDGSQFWAIASASVLRSETGEPETLIGAVHDITDQKAAEARLQSIVDHVANGIITINENGILETVNPAVERIFGYAADEIIGQHACILLPHPDGDDAKDYPAEALRTDEAAIAGAGLELNGRRKDGTTFPIELALSEYRLGGRRMFTGLIRDITERKRTERALSESERRFRSIFEAAQDPVWAFEVSPDGQPLAILEVNDAACHVYGYRRDELVGMPLNRIVVADFDPEQFSESIKRMREEGSVLIESRHRTKFGRRMDVEVRAQLITLADRPAVLAVVRDISERKEAERQLSQLNQELEQRVAERTAEAEHRATQLQLLAAELTDAEHRERRRLAQLLHDELQQILVAAKMRLSITHDSTPDAFINALSGAKDLLSQAIDASRSLSSELAPSVLYDLGLAPALEWLARWARERFSLNVEVEDKVNEATDRLSEQLRILLFQAVRELLLNVVKHAETNEARVLLEKDEASLSITVEDFGRGFDVPTAADRKGTSGGFGLFSLQERLKLMGGQVELESAPDRGTRVTLTVPLRDVPNVDSASTGQPAEGFGDQPPVVGELMTGDGRETEEAPSPIRVLLVDDHEILRQGLANLFSRHADMQVVGESSTGERAIELAQQVQPDVIVMDISLPGISGIEATRRITQSLPHVRVIGLSIHEEYDVCEALRAAGAASYFSKSRRSDELLGAIRELARRNRNT